MSAPRRIWAYSMDAEEDTHGGWDVRQDDGYDAPQSLYHHDDVVRELVEALEFYADRKFTGYEVDISDYGISMSKGEIILDEGDIARAALAKIAQEG